LLLGKRMLQKRKKEKKVESDNRRKIEHVCVYVCKGICESRGEREEEYVRV